MAFEVFAVFGRLWVILLACFQTANAPPSTILPLTSKPPVTPRPSGSHPGQVELSHKQVDPQALEKWREQKQEFLRHPSLRRSKDYHADKGNRKEKAIRFAPPRPPLPPPTFKIQDWSYFPPSDSKPPRPPRPPSGPVPSVIVTPCTPTIPVLPELSSSTTQLSSLDYTGHHKSESDLSAGEIIIEQPDEDINERPISFQLFTTSQFLPTERDIAELRVDDLDNPFRVPDSNGLVETPRRSFNIPQTLKTISFGPLRYTTNALSAVSDMLWDEPSWIYQTSPTDRLAARANSYITSTPAKKRLGNTKDSGPPGRKGYGSPFSDASSPRSLHLPDEQMDLLPYPDVFDLDMYYGLESNRLSIPRQSQTGTGTPSRKRQSMKRTNPVHPSTPKTTDSPKSERRFGFLPDLHSTHRSSFSPENQQVKRYRDHYRHPAYTIPPHLSPETSIDSLGEVKIKTSKESRVLKPASSLTLNKAAPQTPTAPRPAKATPTHPTSNVHVPQLKDRRIHPPPPVVVVSHHQFASSLSQVPTQAECEDPEELRARLREACHNFSKPVWTDESCSLEAVSLS